MYVKSIHILKYEINFCHQLSIDPDDLCPSSCPVVCPPDHTMCPGGVNPDGCPMPETCMPMTFGHDGAVCPAMCPVHCPPDHMWCDGGIDANGCKMPNTCVANTGKQRLVSVI